MAYYKKHSGSGWFNESPRHALAAQGVKTGRFASLGSGLKKTGSAIATGAKWTGQTLAEGAGFGTDEENKKEYQGVVDSSAQPFPESEVSYSWGAGSETSPEVTSYSLDVGDEESLGGFTDSVLGDKEDHSRHHHEVELAHPQRSEGLSGDLLEGDETPAEKIHKEVDELEYSESGLISTPREKFMDRVEDKVQKIKEWYFSNEADDLHDEIINLDSDKILLRDKIGMMNGLKQKVLKSKDVSFGEKVELVERIDKQVAPLIRDLNKLDLKVSESKNLLSKLERENAGIGSSRRLSRPEPLIPSPIQLIKDAIAIHAKGKKPESEVVSVDFSNLKSIKSAERKKSRLENEGYSPKSTKQKGFDKFNIDYERKVKK